MTQTQKTSDDSTLRLALDELASLRDQLRVDRQHDRHEHDGEPELLAPELQPRERVAGCRRGDELAGHDSFLDVVTNIVGILILLVMVVGLRSALLRDSQATAFAGATGVFTPNQDGLADRVYPQFYLTKEVEELRVFLLLPDGRVLARTDTAGPAPPAPSDTWMDALLTKDVGPTVVTIDGRLYHAARAVSEAGGNTFGHVIVAIPVDAAFGRLLADATQDEVVLLAGGVVATTLREGDTPWRSLQEWREAGGGTSGFTDASVGGRRYHAQEVALSAAPALSAIVARLRDDVTAPSREIQRGLPLVALASGALAVAAAWYAARRAARQGL